MLISIYHHTLNLGIPGMYIDNIGMPGMYTLTGNIGFAGVII